MERHKVNEFKQSFRSGVIASTIANVNRAKGSREFKPTQFMLSSDIIEEEAAPDKNPEELLVAFRNAFSGKIIRGQK